MTARDEGTLYVRDVKARTSAVVEALETAIREIPEQPMYSGEGAQGFDADT